MSEFARGALLGRHLFATPEQTVLFTAAVNTEVMSVYVPSDYAGDDPVISLYHIVPGGAAGLDTAVIYQRTLSAFDDAVLLIAQCIGGGLHLQVGESIIGELVSGSQTNIMLYGVTTTLQAVR